MFIDAIEIYLVRNEFKEPWITAYGIDQGTDSVLIKMHSGPQYAWAESSPLNLPHYSSEYASGVYHLLRDHLAGLFHKRNIDSKEQIRDILSPFKGNPFAKSALDVCWWNLSAKIQQIPLRKLFPFPTNDTVIAGADFGIMSHIDELLIQIQQAIDSGYKRVKLKVKQGWDIDVIKAVRSNFPELVFHIDCNASYDLDKDFDFFKQLDQYNLAMIEQPLYHTDLREHAKLQKEINTPICLDESCSSIHTAKSAIEMGACKFMNLKPGRVGGLSDFLDIYALCLEANIPCWVGSMLETSIGTSVLIELATLNQISYPSDLFPTQKLYKKDISINPIMFSNPECISASSVPATAYEPGEKELKARCIHHTIID